MKVIPTARTQGRSATAELNSPEGLQPVTFAEWLAAMPRDKTQNITVTIPFHRNDIGALVRVMLQQQATAEAVLAHAVREIVPMMTDRNAMSGVYGTALSSQNGGAR